jgi:phenylacetate-CoA ligase
MSATPLHKSLFELCRARMNTDEEFLRVNDWTRAPTVNFRIFEQYRLFRLQRTLKYARDCSRFYARHFSGYQPEGIKSIDHLATLPLTDTRDLASDPFAFLCIPQSMVERAVTFTSSGTVGPEKHVFFSEADIEAITDYMAAWIKTVADRSDVVQILLPGGPAFSQSDLLARGVRKMGGRSVFTGMWAPPDEQVKSVIQNRSTVLFGETHLIYRITKLMEKDHNLNRLGVKALFLSTSHASSTMINYLRETWNAEVRTHYGLTEMGLGPAVDCPICGERHFNELDVIGEVIDPETGESLPPDSTGELVLTSIQRQAMPLIRYRTGDIAHFGIANGLCGPRLRTIGPMAYRSESVAHVRNGIFIHPTLFHETLFRIADVIDYELAITLENGVDTLIFSVEASGSDELLRQSIIRQVKEAPLLQDVRMTGIGIRIELKGPGNLKQGPHFKKVIKDERKR